MTMHREMYRASPNEKTINDVFDREFAGRFFRTGNPYTNAVWGTVGTFNEAWANLMQDESSGNGGNGCEVLEVNAKGTPINKPIAA